MGKGWEVRNGGNKDKTQSPAATWLSFGEHLHGRDVGGQEPGTASPSHNTPLSLILLKSATWWERAGEGMVSHVQSSRGRGRVRSPESSEEACFPPEFPAWTLANACPSIPGPAKAVLLLLLLTPQKNSGQEKTQFVTELQGRGGSILQTGSSQLSPSHVLDPKCLRPDPVPVIAA